MATFAVNSGAVVDWDSLSGGSTNATLDLYNISGGSTLFFDCDSYHCLNHSTAFGSLDNVAFQDIGGTVLADTTGVRVITYTVGAGLVPAIGDPITQGGVSAELLGVWADWQSEPTAAGAAMPVTGHIKVKDKTGGDFATGALTGISAVASGSDVQGWIEIRIADTGTCTLPRRGAFRSQGQRFELGTTNGSAGQVLPCPTTATNAGVFTVIFVETAVGSGEFETYKSVGTLAADANIGTEIERAKCFWQTTSGIRLGSDGTNDVGYLPPSGLRVQIPSVIWTCCTRTGGSGSGPRVVPNATLGTRWEFSCDQGTVAMENTIFQAYFNINLAGEFSLIDVGINDTCRITNSFAELTGTRLCVAPTQVQTGNVALFISGCFAGGEFTDCELWRSTLPSVQQVVSVEKSKDIHITGGTVGTLGFRASGNSYSIRLADGASGFIADGVTLIGGKVTAAACSSITFLDTKYIDRFAGTTDSSQGQQIFEFGNLEDVLVEGLEYPLVGLEVYFAIIRLANTCNNVRIRNIGTYASRLDCNGNTEKLVEWNGYGDTVKIQQCFITGERGRVWTDNGYATWKDWVIAEGSQYEPAMDADGGTTIEGTEKFGAAYTVRNSIGWKLAPQTIEEEVHININPGNVFRDAAGPLFNYSLVVGKCFVDGRSSLRVGIQEVGTSGLTSEESTLLTQAATLAGIMESDVSFADGLRILLSLATGNATLPSAAGPYAYRNAANDKDRIAGTVAIGGDGVITRTNTTRDGTL
jgi:hypothetical protein